MNPYRLTLISASLVLALAACAPASDQPGTQPSDNPSEAAASPSGVASASAEPSIDAGPSDAPETSAPEGGSGETATIEIENFAFSPAQLTISAGTEVTVTNLDSAPHTFTAGSDADPEPDVFDSGLLEQGESFTFVFDEPGTFAYYCDRHPPMEGEITVTN